MIDEGLARFGPEVCGATHDSAHTIQAIWTLTRMRAQEEALLR